MSKAPGTIWNSVSAFLPFRLRRRGALLGATLGAAASLLSVWAFFGEYWKQQERLELRVESADKIQWPHPQQGALKQENGENQIEISHYKVSIFNKSGTNAIIEKIEFERNSELPTGDFSLDLGNGMRYNIEPFVRTSQGSELVLPFSIDANDVAIVYVSLPFATGLTASDECMGGTRQSPRSNRIGELGGWQVGTDNADFRICNNQNAQHNNRFADFVTLDRNPYRAVFEAPILMFVHPKKRGSSE